MDIDKVFRGLTITKRRVRSLELTYRRYYKLKTSEKKIFDTKRCKYTPLVCSLAIELSKITKEPLKGYHFRIASKLIKPYLNKVTLAAMNDFLICPTSYKDSKYLIRELEFQGFIPLSSYKPKFKKYGYFMTNRPLNGVTYIYPKKFGDTHKALSKGCPYYTEYMGQYGIQGIIKFRYSDE